MPESYQSSTRTDEERDFAAITDEEIWTEAKDRLKISEEAETENHRRAKTAMLFREGDQWDHTVTTTTSADEPELTINLTDAMVRRVVNNMKQQRPRGKCHPVGEGADVEIAEILNGLGRHVETRSEASVAYDLAGERAIDAGVGYFRLIAEYLDPRSFQKDLRILPIRNIFTVSMDPDAIMPSGADQNWNVISMLMPRQEYKRRFPNAKNISWTDVGRDAQRLTWENKESVRLAEYFRVHELPMKLYLLRNKTGDERTIYHNELPRKPDDGRVVMDHAVKHLAKRDITIEGERDSIKRQVEWFRLNGTTVIERQQIPGQYIPVFRVEGNVIDIDGKIRRRGMVEAMMDPQRMVNYGEVAKIKRLGLAPKAPWIGAEGQFDGHDEWDDANQKPYSKLVYKPVVIETSSGAIPLPPPVRQPPAQIEAGFSEFVQGMRSNLMAIAGAPNEPGQDQQGVVVSGRAINRRQWLSDQSHFQYYDNLTLAITQCWRVMVEWFPHYYGEPGRIQRVIGEDSTPEMVTLNEKVQDGQDDEGNAIERVKNDLSVGRYDVVMDTGPGYETKREEGAENLIDLMKVEPLAELIAKQGADLVFRSIDHPYMQELADRLMAANPDGLKKIMEGLSSRARSVVQSLANQVQALTQQNQQLQQDLKGGLTKAHLDATVKAHGIEEREKTARMDTLVRAHAEQAREAQEDATWQHDIEMREHGKIKAEEIKGFVQLLLQNKEHFMRALEMVAGQQESALDREQAAQQPATNGVA